MTIVTDQRAVPDSERSPVAARRAVVRWAWRLFRREWRQQVLILILLVVAVAVTVIGAGAATNGPQPPSAQMGAGNNIVYLSADSPQALTAGIASAQQWFGTIDVIEHQSVAIPGALNAVDVRAEDPHGPYAYPTVKMLSGGYPVGPGQIALTKSVASTLRLKVGSTWDVLGQARRVVGLVQNPQNFNDQFALVAPGQIANPNQVEILVKASQNSISGFSPSYPGVTLQGSASFGTSKQAAALAVLILSTIALLFVGLVGAAGFTVLAHRRLRALGMLGAVGATDRHVRLVMVANGAAVGATAAVVGTIVGIGGWLAFVPVLQNLTAHTINHFNLPWWALGTSMGLALVTAVLAAWWPARTIARIPIVAALSGRPPKPQPAHRFAALGAVFVGGGIALLAYSHQHKAAMIVGGIIGIALGVLFLAPLGITAVAASGRRARISIRLPLRDLARYQARSGAALAAVALAIGIAATIVISAAAQQASDNANNHHTLPANQAEVYLTYEGQSGTDLQSSGGSVPSVSSTQLASAQEAINSMAASLGTKTVVPLDVAVNPSSPLQPLPPEGGAGSSGPVRVGVQSGGVGSNGLMQSVSLVNATLPGPRGGPFSITQASQPYVATPALLEFFGVNPNQILPNSDVITSLNGISHEQLSIGGQRSCQTGNGSPTVACLGVETTTFQHLGLPTYSSDPNALITPHFMAKYGLETEPAGWLIKSPKALTSAQIGTLDHQAAASGLTVATRPTTKSSAPLRDWATAAGLLLALGVLAMTVGLIRSETASDLRTLTAAGASPLSRRNLTGVTAAALGLVGGVLGTLGAYAAQMAFFRSQLNHLSHVPIMNLAVILVGLPLGALVAGWIVAGREPPGFARQPIE